MAGGEIRDQLPPERGEAIRQRKQRGLTPLERRDGALDVGVALDRGGGQREANCGGGPLETRHVEPMRRRSRESVIGGLDPLLAEHANHRTIALTITRSDLDRNGTD